MPIEMKYFVLKPRAKSVKDFHALASQSAMYHYAAMIEEENPELAGDLRAWVRKEVVRMGVMARGLDVTQRQLDELKTSTT